MDGAIASAQATEEDYIANTFSKFGLNINLLMGISDEATNTSEMAESGLHNR